jgi:glycosyltransferase involved in cell wall biosynthesis
MACGLPVITSRLAGVTDSIVEEEKSGLFFEVGNREMLKTKVQELLRDSSLAETLGKNARKKVENDYDIKKVAELHASLYEELSECAE